MQSRTKLPSDVVLIEETSPSSKRFRVGSASEVAPDKSSASNSEQPKVAAGDLLVQLMRQNSLPGNEQVTGSVLLSLLTKDDVLDNLSEPAVQASLLAVCAEVSSDTLVKLQSLAVKTIPTLITAGRREAEEGLRAFLESLQVVILGRKKSSLEAESLQSGARAVAVNETLRNVENGWQGTLRRVGSSLSARVVATEVRGQAIRHVLSHLDGLECSMRVTYAEVSKRLPEAVYVLLLNPSPTLADAQALSQHVTYFQSKQRVGVAKISAPSELMAYLVPHGPFTRSVVGEEAYAAHPKAMLCIIVPA